MYANYTIRKEKKIHSSLSRAWDTIVKPENIETWLGIKVESEWEEGSPITFSYIFFNKKYSDKGSILQIEPMKLFSYSYWSAFSGLPDEPENYSMVTFELHAGENAVQLILLHHDIHTMEMYEYFDKSWEETLNQIKELAEKTEEVHAFY